MACGFGDSIAYDALVQATLKRRLDKSSRFTDWSRRPLSDAQLAYALADVTHLRDLYPKMKQTLESQGRLHWLDEEHADLSDPEIYDMTPENAWKRLKLRKVTQDYVLALQTAAAWREKQAQQRDVPRGRIVKDDALYEIAEHRPRDRRIRPHARRAARLRQFALRDRTDRGARRRVCRHCAHPHQDRAPAADAERRWTYWWNCLKCCCATKLSVIKSRRA